MVHSNLSPEALSSLPYREIWAVDFEFIAGAGENLDPVCLVAWELRSGRKLRLWQDEFRGRYMAAASRIERAGVPIDVATLHRLRRHWSAIQDELITDIDAEYGVYDGRTFKADRFAGLLQRLGIPWRSLPSGALDLSDN